MTIGCGAPAAQHHGRIQQPRAALGRLAGCLGALLLPALAIAAGPSAFEVSVLTSEYADASPSAVADGSLEAHFQPLHAGRGVAGGNPTWVRLLSRTAMSADGSPALVVREPRAGKVLAFRATDSKLFALPTTASLPALRGGTDVVFALPGGLGAGERLYLRLDDRALAGAEAGVTLAPLRTVLEHGADHTRMIAFAFGALLAMALASLLISFVFVDRLFMLYGALFGLQALYIAYLSGQGFDWPVLGLARPLASHAWNVPAALSGAVACLFVREIADLSRFSPRVYRVFGGLAVAFVLLACANGLKFLGIGPLVSALGNVMFLGTTLFTLVVAFLAWRRGIRAAGWFLIAWLLLEGFTTLAALRLLLGVVDESDSLLYVGLPMSMVSAAVLTALGVADRLRDQRRALSDAERRAQTDPLTGVLNRRSLIERLEAASLRARARELPITLLFLDLDHFKTINDTRGHAAGDACLRAVVGPIQAELRQSDVVGRYGGEEFVVILSSADTGVASAIAERIRDRVANTLVEGFGAPIRLTCSIGVAGSDALGVWGEQLIARADDAVYGAKNAGRNRVEVAAPAPVAAAAR
ncbi:MAG: diguanylate cyclase [Proteobacteria bacterium]|nr:diguanylate cyclase [Pseudomonadota bacterium]